MIKLKLKLKNSTLSEKFQNPIENIRNRGKIDLTKTHDYSLYRLGTGNKK
jgi:hypothetical protein